MRPGAFQLPPAARVTAVMAWRRVLQALVIQLRDGAGAEAGWRQPSRAPRQGPPAVTVMARCVSGGAALHRPLRLPQPVKLRRQRPATVLQVLQVAVTVERPAVNAAGPTAPVAGLRGARPGVVGLRPAGASVGPVEPRAGQDADLPGPARLPAAHEPSPPGLVAGLRPPTKPAGMAKPEPHRAPTVLPGSRACRARPGRLTRRRNGRRVLHRGGLDRPVVSGAARVGLVRPTKQVVDGPLGPFSLRGWHSTGRCGASTGLCGDLEQHLHDQER
jgi:hypothetical protein